MRYRTDFKRAFHLTLPTLFAYCPLGVVFGLLWLQAGMNGFAAPLVSMSVYAGAVQFLALSMMTMDASVSHIMLAAAFVALRNVFYGLSFIERFAGKPRWLKPFLMFGLVDATYAILNSVSPDEVVNDAAFCGYVSLLPYLYWVTGTLLGVLLSNVIPPLPGIDFVLTAFFMVLVVEGYLASRSIVSLVAPLIFALIAYLLLPGEYLLLAILLSSAFISLRFKPEPSEETAV